MISIRKLKKEDVYTVHEYSSDFENTYYMLNNPVSTLDETKAFVEKCIEAYEMNPIPYLSMAVLWNDVHIGEVFASISGEEADIGWIINKNYWGKGYATEAAKLFMDYLSNEFGIKKFAAYCDARNYASQKVMEQIGLQFIGRNGARIYKKNVTDGEELMYSYTRL